MNSLFMNSSQKAVHKNALKIAQRYSKSAEESIEEKVSSLRKKDKDDMLSAAFKSLPSVTRIREKLDKSGKEVSIKQYLSWMVTTFGSLLVLLNIIMGFGIIPTFVIALLLSHMIPNFIVNRWIKKRMKNFLKLLPDALDLMIRGLRSGLPVTESITVIASEIQDPVKSIFQEISDGMKMGIPFEDSLMDMARKLELNEFNFFVISIALQRETGGNLAEILENLSETVRARAMMKLKIKALSSEARASSYIVGALPFLVSLALLMISPDYLDPLFETRGGNISLASAMFMFVFGMFIMRRMGDFEI